MIKDLFKRHKRATLMYSGGKDSLACLLLLKPYWDRLDVVWVNTGNQFPEVREHMKKVAKLVPHFTELHSNTPEYFRQNGFPVDVVPTRHTGMGQFIYGPTGLRVCSRFECCGVNIWQPLAQYQALHKPTCIIRGDRGEERVIGPREADGTEYAFPIFDWTAEQVQELVRTAPKGLYQPRHELKAGSSLDCMTCTAYWDEHSERMRYLKEHHPELHLAQQRFFEEYRALVAEEMLKLKE